MLTERENTLRTIDRTGPEWIPTSVHILPATWHKCRKELERLVVAHPFAYGAYEPGSMDFDHFQPRHRAGRFTDPWGCVWDNSEAGMMGVVVEHPLADWDAFDSFTPPDSLRYHEFGEWPAWEDFAKRLDAYRRRDQAVPVGVNRLFERLQWLRGYENLMIDFMTGEPKVEALIEMIVENNLRLIAKHAEFKPDVVLFMDDLGTQNQLMMSPALFKKHLVPAYARMFEAVKQCGARILMHSDGCILEAMPDLIECGLDAINPQITPNTLEGIARVMKGKVAVELDLDRQQVLPFGTPRQVRAHIIKAVEHLADPSGGLALVAECAPSVPLSNIEAILQTFDEVMDRVGG